MAEPTSWKVLVSDYEYPDLRIEEEVLAAGLRGRMELVAAACRTEADLAEAAAGADAVLNQYCPVGARAIAALAFCRIISRYGVGFDTVDVAAATAAGICVTNVPDYCVDEVSDHALALLMAAARRIVRLDALVRGGRWDYRAAGPVRRLRGLVLGLLGFGRMPRALAVKAGAIGLRVLAHDPFVPDQAVRAAGVEPAGMERLMREADFVSVHVPLADGTRGLVDERFLRSMKGTAVLINTSRGPVVDQGALVRVLREGGIAGAALDVLEREPVPPGHPLLDMPNVVLTPHTAWYSEESEQELRRKAAENVVRVLRGERPPYLVNAEVWERHRGA